MTDESMTDEETGVPGPAAAGRLGAELPAGAVMGRVVDHIQTQGLQEISMRRLAAVAGTSLARNEDPQRRFPI